MNPSGNGVAPDFLAETKQPVQAQTDNTVPAGSGTGQPYVPKTDKKQVSLKERLGMWLAGGIVGLLLVLVVASRISPRNRSVQTNSPLDGNKNTAQAGQPAPANGPSILPITDAGRPQADTNDKSNLAGEDIARTASRGHRPRRHPVWVASHHSTTSSRLGRRGRFRRTPRHRLQNSQPRLRRPEATGRAWINRRSCL